jgi:transcription antitermination protein NusB
MNGKQRNLSRARGIARKCAMQALYQWQLTQQDHAEIASQFAGTPQLEGGDTEYFAELLRECTARSGELDQALTPFLDRPAVQLDPVEHAILWIGLYELAHRVDVPFRVVINEGVELTKDFGATDGHRYINGVLDKAAQALRSAERS